MKHSQNFSTDIKNHNLFTSINTENIKMDTYVNIYSEKEKYQFPTLSDNNIDNNKIKEYRNSIKIVNIKSKVIFLFSM